MTSCMSFPEVSNSLPFQCCLCCYSEVAFLAKGFGEELKGPILVCSFVI